MKERKIPDPQKEKPQLIIKSKQEITTDGIKVVQFNLFFEEADYTIYSHLDSNFGLENVIKGIKIAKLWTQNPMAIECVKSDGYPDPQKYIEIESHNYLNALKTKKNTYKFNEDVFFPLIKQQAMSLLFKEAKKSQK